MEVVVWIDLVDVGGGLFGLCFEVFLVVVDVECWVGELDVVVGFDDDVVGCV